MIRGARFIAVAGLLIAAGLTVADPAHGDVSPMDCLPPADQQHIAEGFQALLKARGLTDSEKMSTEIGKLTRDWMAQSAAAQACLDEHDESDDTGGGHCQRERATAKQAETDLQAWSTRMEEIGQAMEAIRARYRACG